MRKVFKILGLCFVSAILAFSCENPELLSNLVKNDNSAGNKNESGEYSSESKHVKAEPDPEGKYGVKITVYELAGYTDIRILQINEDSKNIDCFLDYTEQYPITVYFPLTEDGKEYSFCYYAQTDGTKENRTVITENFSCKASGGFGELLDASAMEQYKCVASHEVNSVSVQLALRNSGTSAQIIKDDDGKISKKYLYIEVAKGTNNWDEKTVWISGMTETVSNMSDLTKSYTFSVPEGKFSTGDSYFAQASIICYFEDKTLFPYWFRIEPVASDNLTW